MTRVFTILIALAACKDSVDEELVRRYMAKIRPDLEKAKAGLVAKNETSAVMVCSSMVNLEDIKKTDATLAVDLAQFCTRDYPLWVMRHAVDKAEAARKLDPKSTFLPDCTDLFYPQAVEDLQTYGTATDETRALEARMTAACPK
ncbi:MAG: hypothetical protein JWP01_366 [Myxococcales bacterium]|nr:hypothetical protein [Myxococcales bacterium]